MAAETFTARGAGGAVFTIDVPKPGSRQEELLVEKLRKAELVVIDEDGNTVPFAEPPTPDARAEVDEAGMMPPKAGPGSTREAWAEHAMALGLDVTEDESRDDLIAAVEAHNASQD